ncbi:Kazal-type serine protease inhibitor family protein [Algoriphagus sanaruensis]|uniref:Kazal-type serine protease inhibitor family protein n=1 Tax=Algoriphagus sanaruensis TaxID=1727163 RepID=UPI0009EF3522
MRFLKFLIFFISPLFLFQCTEKSEPMNLCFDSEISNRPDECIAIYNPVCGCDGITYYNSCYAQSSGIRAYAPGSCNPTD